MGRVFVLGAGFSKAVAQLPLASELLGEFRVLCERERAQQHLSWRYQYGREIRRFVDVLREERIRVPFAGEWSGSPITDIPEGLHLEIILSMLEFVLSLKRFDDVSGGKDPLWPKCLHGAFDPKEVRSWFTTYLYMALERGTPRESLLKEFVSHVQSGRDTFVTFNYDLELERALYAEQLWSPREGYGIDIDPQIQVADNARFDSGVKIHKLHGSLNWDPSGTTSTVLNMRWSFNQVNPDTDLGQEIFPEFLQDPATKIPRRTGANGKSEDYRGKEDADWILPTLFKQFAKPPFETVWGNAAFALSTAEEVVIIGYSLSSIDANAIALLSLASLGGKKITVVDRDPAVTERVKRMSGEAPVTCYECLEQYLSGTSLLTEQSPSHKSPSS